MPKKRPANLLPMKPARKRSTWAQRTKQQSRGASALFKAFNEAPKLVELKSGETVREWGPSDWRHMTNEDVRTALRGKAAFDHEELLAWIPPQTIKDALTRGWLYQGEIKGLYWVTRKAAADLGLPRKTNLGQAIRFLSPTP